MKLNNNKKEFQELITLTARWRNIPEDAVKNSNYCIIGYISLFNKIEKTNKDFKKGFVMEKEKVTKNSIC